MKLLALIILILSTTGIGSAQTVIIDSKNQIEKDRYKGFDGNPYLYNDFTSADIIMTNAKIYSNVMANLNVYSGEIEVRQDAKHIALESKNIGQIKFNNDDVTILQRGRNYNVNKPFVSVLYESKNYALIEVFECTLNETTIQDVGRTVKIRRFRNVSDYLLDINGKREKIEIDQRDLLKVLPTEAKSILKENKWKLKKADDLIKLLQKLDE